MKSSRTAIYLTMCVFLASCGADENPTTSQGEALIHGKVSNAFVRTIDHPDYPAVLLSDEEGVVGIGIFQPGTGSPILTLRDDNNDGVFDLLTYSALSASGEAFADVEDYGMDGQPDFILNHQDSSAKVFVDGSWHEVDGVGTQEVTVSIEGRRVPLKEIMSALRRSN